jgi:hypothetical protein
MSQLLAFDMQPHAAGTNRIYVHMDDPCARAPRVAFCQRTHHGLKNRRLGLPAVIRCPIP